MITYDFKHQALTPILLWTLFMFINSYAQENRDIVNAISAEQPNRELLNKIMNEYFSNDLVEQTSSAKILKAAYDQATAADTKIMLLAIYAGKKTPLICELLIDIIENPQDQSIAGAAVNLLGNQDLSIQQVHKLLGRCSTIDGSVGSDQYHGAQLGNTLMINIARAGKRGAFQEIHQLLSQDNVSTEILQIAPMVYSAMDAPEAIPILLEKAKKCNVKSNYMTVSTFSALTATISRQCKEKNMGERENICRPVIDLFKACSENQEAHSEVHEIAFIGLAQILSASNGQFVEVKTYLEQNRNNWDQSKSAKQIQSYIEHSQK